VKRLFTFHYACIAATWLLAFMVIADLVHPVVDGVAVSVLILYSLFLLRMGDEDRMEDRMFRLETTLRDNNIEIPSMKEFEDGRS
jgi:hypothetical protein